MVACVLCSLCRTVHALALWLHSAVTAEHLFTTFAVECAHIVICAGHMPDSMYSDLLLLRDLNFFLSLDPNQSNLSLASDQSPDECPLTEVIDDCLSSLFGKWAWHGSGDCDVDYPQVAVNESEGHLSTCLIEVPLQDTLQNQTVRVTACCIAWLNVLLYCFNLHLDALALLHCCIYT